MKLKIRIKSSMLLIFLIVLECNVFAKPTNKTATEINGLIYEIIDGKEFPLPFANVMCKGTVDGTFAGSDGDFNFKMNKGKYTLIISCFGYQPVEKEIIVKNKSSFEELKIVLQPVDNSIAQK